MEEDVVNSVCRDVYGALHCLNAHRETPHSHSHSGGPQLFRDRVSSEQRELRPSNRATAIFSTGAYVLDPGRTHPWLDDVQISARLGVRFGIRLHISCGEIIARAWIGSRGTKVTYQGSINSYTHMEEASLAGIEVCVGLMWRGTGFSKKILKHLPSSMFIFQDSHWLYPDATNASLKPLSRNIPPSGQSSADHLPHLLIPRRRHRTLPLHPLNLKPPRIKIRINRPDERRAKDQLVP